MSAGWRGGEKHTLTCYMDHGMSHYSPCTPWTCCCFCAAAAAPAFANCCWINMFRRRTKEDAVHILQSTATATAITATAPASEFGYSRWCVFVTLTHSMLVIHQFVGIVPDFTPLVMRAVCDGVKDIWFFSNNSGLLLNVEILQFSVRFYSTRPTCSRLFDCCCGIYPVWNIIGHGANANQSILHLS